MNKEPIQSIDIDAHSGGWFVTIRRYHDEDRYNTGQWHLSMFFRQHTPIAQARIARLRLAQDALAMKEQANDPQ